MTYKVLVDDNFHYMDESERYAFGEFDTAEAALAAAKSMVDEDIASFYKEGMSAGDVYSQYTAFGVDPFIVSDAEKVEFSAWTYAKARSEELYGETIEVEPLKSLAEWFLVQFNAENIHVDARPPGRDGWQADIRWDSIVRVCFKTGDLLDSDEIYIFTDERSESYVIPTEAGGGIDLWYEIIGRKLFDAEIAIQAASSNGEVFCWPAIDI
ncbi:MAG: hypothetical protein H7070_16025 [Saprospiraceae bacterium]|nr:hypothetical protein [Pyrinomonadaceae bacterium]